MRFCGFLTNIIWTAAWLKVKATYNQKSQIWFNKKNTNYRDHHLQNNENCAILYGNDYEIGIRLSHFTEKTVAIQIKHIRSSWI